MAIHDPAVFAVMASLWSYRLSVSVIASALLTAQSADAADAGACTISEAKFEVYADEKTGQPMVRFHRLEIGQVYRLGSLSVRSAGRANGKWVLDLKAPGFAASNQLFADDEPVTYSICGQEVSVTVSIKPSAGGTALIVSVF